jgi:hypothetical protein
LQRGAARDGALFDLEHDASVALGVPQRHLSVERLQQREPTQRASACRHSACAGRGELFSLAQYASQLKSA